MPPTATKTAPPRKELDDAALAAELEEQRGEEDEDGLGPVSDPPLADPPPADDSPPPAPPVDPVDDDPPPSAEEPPPPTGENGEPPTPPAHLPEGDHEPEESGEEETPTDDAPTLGIVADRELGLKVGGRKPDSSTLHLKGGKIELRGPKGSQFDRGDRFLAVATLQVTGDNDQDTIVKHTGETTSTSKKQSATLCGIERVEDWLADRLRQGLDEDDVAKVFGVLGLEKPALEE